MHQIPWIVAMAISTGQGAGGGAGAACRSSPEPYEVGPLVDRVGHVPERSLQPGTGHEDICQAPPELGARAGLDGHRVDALPHLADELEHLLLQVETNPVRVYRVIGNLIRQAARDLNVAPGTG